MERRQATDLKKSIQMNLLIRSEAEQDISEAFDWYEKQSPGLGFDFLLNMEAGFALLERHPQISAVLYRGIRRLLVRRFPYAIYYISEEKTVWIIGILHLSRNPKVWKSRHGR